MKKPAALVTVVILTFNGETYLRRLLSSLSSQQLDAPFEVVALDSGSTDRTLEIVRDFPAVRLFEIPNREFGHGRTRNLAATLSGAEFTAFLTQDAIPLTDSWLANLIRPMRDDSRVAAVLGRQAPRTRAFPLQKYEIDGTFAAIGPPDRVTVFDPATIGPDHPSYAYAAFFSDVNAGARTEVLLGPVPYRDVLYAEDQWFGRDLLAAGYQKAYAPTAVVEHSNDLTWREYGMRVFDETLGLRRAGLPAMRTDALRALYHAARASVGDTLRIGRDADYGLAQKFRWWVVNPFYQLRKWRSIARASATELSDERRAARGSLESRRRHVAQKDAARPNA